MPDGTITTDEIPEDDQAVAEDVDIDQVTRLLRGDQKREPSRPSYIWTSSGEGEHQMKGTYANVNPVEVGEAEAFLKRETETALASQGRFPDQVIPRETKVVSGINKYTDLDLADDTRVAGGREAGQFAEAMGLARDWDDYDNRTGDKHDPTKVDPRTGVAYTNAEGGTVVLNPDGTVGISLDPLGIQAEITVDASADPETIDPNDLPAGVDATDAADKEPSVTSLDIPLGGFDYPVKVEDGVPAVGEDGHAILVDRDGEEYASATDVDAQATLDDDREEALGLNREELAEKHDLRQDINAEANDQRSDPVERTTDVASPEEINPEPSPAVNAITTNAVPEPQPVDADGNPILAPDSNPMNESGAPEADTVPTTGAPDPAESEVIGTEQGDVNASNQSGGTWSMENTKAELEEEAERRGLDSSGNKQEILDRLNG